MRSCTGGPDREQTGQFGLSTGKTEKTAVSSGRARSPAGGFLSASAEGGRVPAAPTHLFYCRTPDLNKSGVLIFYSDPAFRVRRADAAPGSVYSLTKRLGRTAPSV